MNETLIANLHRQCDGPRDGALLRFALGNALLDAGDASTAIVQLGRAVSFDAGYSAAWKQLGKACLAAGDSEAAAAAWHNGIEAATQRGDTQSGKEMHVFLRRLDRSSG